MPLSPGPMNSQMQNMRPPQQMPPMHQQLPMSQGMPPMQQPQSLPQQLPQQTAPQGQQLPQKQGRVTSVSKPIGIDPILILQERENRYKTEDKSCTVGYFVSYSIFSRVSARIANRMEELSNSSVPENLKLKAEIELRALRVLNFQRQLRAEVSSQRIFSLIFFLLGKLVHMFQLAY